MIYLYLGIGLGILGAQLATLGKDRKETKDFLDAAAILTTSLVIITVWPLCILIAMKFKK